MSTNKISLLIAMVTLIVLSSAKKETEESYKEQIRNISSLPLVGGDTLTAEEIEGKLIILNFWASYDAASRINNYDLLRLNQSYQDKSFFEADGLEVVSVSLDTYRSQLVKAIAADETQCFKHICDFKGTESALCKSFDIDGPVNILISTDGRVLARDYGVGKIESALATLHANN
ncbi:MAG: TlpA disulfide reductase family protein [Bacteroidia bacterium]|nr:TlpA disulfide reductase family protein [Bacteroidia bacterium]